MLRSKPGCGRRNRRLREYAFENALQLAEAKPDSPLILPSHFAIHMGVVSRDNFLLLRQRTVYTELYPGAWEAGIGEFMHGPMHEKFRHFTKTGTPDLYLFLKNAVYEEINYSGARRRDFTIYGFAVEYRTLAPKLLVVYKSELDIDQLRQGAQGARDSSPKTDKVPLSVSGVASAVTDRKYLTWGPTSKLVMMLALTRDGGGSGESEVTRPEGPSSTDERAKLIRAVREKVQLAMALSEKR